MLNYIIVFVFQFLFNIFKTLEIKFTFENKITPLLMNSVWINLVSLASVFYSIEGLLAGDLLILPFYISGSVIGKWFAMKKMDNIRGRIFQILFFQKRKVD
jgi:hypothetical protein